VHGHLGEVKIIEDDIKVEMMTGLRTGHRKEN